MRDENLFSSRIYSLHRGVRHARRGRTGAKTSLTHARSLLSRVLAGYQFQGAQGRRMNSQRLLRGETLSAALPRDVAKAWEMV